MHKTLRTWLINEDPRHFFSVMARVVRSVNETYGEHRLVCRPHPMVEMFAPFFKETILATSNFDKPQLFVPDFPRNEIYQFSATQAAKLLYDPFAERPLHYHQLIGEGMQLGSGGESIEWLWDEVKGYPYGGYCSHLHAAGEQNWNRLAERKSNPIKSVYIAPADPFDTIVDYYPMQVWQYLLPSLSARNYNIVTTDKLWHRHPAHSIVSSKAFTQETPSIWEQLYLLATASVFVGFESWLAHAAVSLGIPALIFFPVESIDARWIYSLPWVETVQIDREKYDPQGLANVVLSWIAPAAEGNFTLR